MRTAALLSALSVCVLLGACGGGTSAANTSATVDTPAPAPLTDAQRAAAVAALPAPYNAANIENGQRKFALCRSCHTITPGGGNMTGPNLHGVFGRRAGTVPGFAYSEAVRNAGFEWDASHLDQWLSNPRGFMPGTKMTFAGIHVPEDRRDLIAYLMVESAPRTAPAAAHDDDDDGDD